MVDLPRGVLFGGSNSVIRGGFSDGLKAHLPELQNVAVGRSTSQQNLFELIRHQEAMSQMDFVITESNVNDSLAAAKLNDVTFVNKNTDWFYYELNKFNLPTYIVLMPLRQDGSTREKHDLIANINECHRLNARRYGFHLIDLERAVTRQKEAHINLLMTDARHPHPLLLHHLGRNIACFLIENHRCAGQKPECPSTSPNHTTYLFGDNESQKIRKYNSRFDEWLLPVSEAISVPEVHAGKQLVGVAAWCDDDLSRVVFRNRTSCANLEFDGLYSFEDMRPPFDIDDNTHVGPVQPNNTYTEKLRRLFGQTPRTNARLIGLLLRERHAIINYPPAKPPIMLNEVIPPLLPYILGLEFHQKKQRQN